ncbi:MAG: TetR/AcrR family transcriptional regulator [Acidimicrobiia bacterium]
MAGNSTNSTASTDSDGDAAPTRKALILESAVELFRRKGYEATGIDEIGAAAGITGPGVYRHYGSKQEILDEVVRQSAAVVLQHADRIVEGKLAARDQLDALVDGLVDDVLVRPDMVTVLLRERRHLSPNGKRTWTRSVSDYQAEWFATVSELRPDLSESELDAAVWMAIGMALAAAQYDRSFPREKLAPLLHDMLVGALLGPDGR